MLDEFLNTQIVFSITLSNAAEGLIVSQGSFIELSLDCVECEKRFRTVAVATSDADVEEMRRAVKSYAKELPASDSTAICLPSGHTFPASIREFKVERLDDSILLTTTLAYRFESFVSQSRWRGGASDSECPWIRTRFKLICPGCQTSTSRSVQTNLVRPHRCQCESCGLELYVDAVAPEIRTQSV